MTDIHIERTHQLGLAEARQVARRWSDEAGKRLEMAFTVHHGDTGDTVAFTRPGVKGSLRVEADRFTIDAQLGFLLGAFKRTIESEIERNLDDLLNQPVGDMDGIRAVR